MRAALILLVLAAFNASAALIFTRYVQIDCPPAGQICRNCIRLAATALGFSPQRSIFSTVFQVAKSSPMAIECCNTIRVVFKN